MFANAAVILGVVAALLCRATASAQDLTTSEVNRVDNEATDVGADFENSDDSEGGTVLPEVEELPLLNPVPGKSAPPSVKLDLRRETEIDANLQPLGGYSAFEANEPILVRSGEGSRGPPTSHTGCQYVFSIPSGPQCSSSLVDAKVAQLQLAFRAFETKLDSQQSRLEATETFVLRINAALNKNGLFTNLEETTGQISSRSTQQADDDEGAAKALLDLADSTHEQLLRLQVRVENMETERVRLARDNDNLTNRLRDALRNVDDLTQDKEHLLDTVSQRNRELQRLLTENEALRNVQETLTSQKKLLENSKDLLSKRVLDLTSDNERLRSSIKSQSDEVHKLLGDKTITESRLANATAVVEELEQALATSRSRNNGTDSHESTTPCNITSDVGDDSSGQSAELEEDYSQCGRLVAVSEPETVGESPSAALSKYGVWMKDPLAAPKSQKVWAIKVIRPRIVKLMEYNNLQDFRHHRMATLRRLQVPLESTGAVVYNGSLYYQRRNSKRIVRYDIDTQTTVRQRPIKFAGFHGMFTYHWGGYSDIDFAVDETGLWVIYSTSRNKGKIVVSKIDPVTLQPLALIRTNISKRNVANAFIVCGTLYTVGSNSATRATVNYSVNLRTRRTKKLNIPFTNRYRYNVMIDYNPRDRYLYSWDNAHQVRYKITLDTAYGEIRNGKIIPKSRTRS